jgi:hypothetical protein
VAEVVDLYGSTGKFDVIAITDHILMKKDMLARAAGWPRSAAGLRRPRRGLRRLPRGHRDAGAARVDTYGMLVSRRRGDAEPAQRRKNSHIIALDIKRYVSADQPADAILQEIRARAR